MVVNAYLDRANRKAGARAYAGSSHVHISRSRNRNRGSKKKKTFARPSIVIPNSTNPAMLTKSEVRARTHKIVLRECTVMRVCARARVYRSFCCRCGTTSRGCQGPAYSTLRYRTGSGHVTKCHVTIQQVPSMEVTMITQHVFLLVKSCTWQVTQWNTVYIT